MKEYKTNPFFKTKIDMALQKIQIDSAKPNKYHNEEQNGTETLRGKITKENQAFNLRLLEIKSRIDSLKPMWFILSNGIFIFRLSLTFFF